MKYLQTHWVALLLLVMLSTSTLAQSNIRLSNEAEVSILTCLPGSELYSVFGHSAIRVHDPIRGYDLVYHYGTFSFDTEYFYLKFMRGELNYYLSVSSLDHFMMQYQHYNRSVYEQVLDLSNTDKLAVFQFLEFNRLPENKYYLYDFFYDNCATRIRDVFLQQLEGKVQLQPLDTLYSFRSIIKPYLSEMPWAEFGINLVFGDKTDTPIDVSKTTFLPDYLHQAFMHATITYGNETRPVMKAADVLFEASELTESGWGLSPAWVFWVILVLVVIVSLWEYNREANYRLVDFILFFTVGIVGLIMLLFWTATIHKPVVNNWNLLWAMPSHLVLAFWLFRKQLPHWMGYYWSVSAGLSALVLLLWLVIPQHLDRETIPILLIIALRSTLIFYRGGLRPS